VILFAAMGVRQRRRQGALARKALKLGLRFSGDDLFDIPRRYAEMSLMGSGHSLAAQNVMYGHMENDPVRAFDLNYEIGHGTSRSTRRYLGALLEVESPLPELLVWRPCQEWTLPMDGDGRVGPWSYVGRREQVLAALDAGLDDVPDGGCFQVRGNVLLLGLPRQRSSDAGEQLPVLRPIARAMEKFRRESAPKKESEQTLPASAAKPFAKPATA
jgi:hypothetical protein